MWRRRPWNFMSATLGNRWDETGQSIGSPTPTGRSRMFSSRPQGASGLRRRDDTGGCPEPVEVTMDGCQDFVLGGPGDTYLQSQGRILEVRATLHSVPRKAGGPGRAAFGGGRKKGSEHPLGMKTVTVPVHHCRPAGMFLVQGIRFILPEDLNVSGTPGKLCTPRNLRVRLFSHYVTTISNAAMSR